MNYAKLRYALYASGRDSGSMYSQFPCGDSTELSNYAYDVVRASNASYYDQGGLLRYATSNYPVFANLDGEDCPFIYTQGAVSNIIDYTEDFTNAMYTASGVTISNYDSYGPSIDNVSSALVATGTGDIPHTMTFTPGIGDGSIGVLSIYAQYLSPGDSLTIKDSTGAIEVTYDLEAATDSRTSGLDSGIYPTGYKDWYRCWVSFEGATDMTISISPSSSLSFSQDGESINIFGLNLIEYTQGDRSEKVLPYIKNTDSRAADSIVGKDTQEDLLNSKEGVFLVELMTNTGEEGYVGVNDGTTSNRLIFGIDSSGRFTIIKNTATIYYQDISTYNLVSAVVRYKENGEVQVYINGTLVKDEVFDDALFSKNLKKFSFNNGSSKPFYGYVKRILHFDYLEDSEIQDLYS